MNKRGVTLIELVVVFVIIAIAAVLIAPNIGGWLPRYRLRSATRDIVGTMRAAQMKAVSNRVQYRVNFAPNGYVLQRDSGGFVNDGPVWTIPAGITINTNLPGGTAVFKPDSTCDNGGSITLSQEKGGIVQSQKGIRLSASTGRVRINE